jgi:hypothetical protein
MHLMHTFQEMSIKGRPTPFNYCILGINCLGDLLGDDDDARNDGA